MAEYTYKDVIIDPEDPRVEVGKEYYSGDNPRVVINKANEGKTSSILASIYTEKDNYHPFYFGRNTLDFYPCIIRKKDPEKKWVPFDLSKEEDRKKLRGAWVRHKNSGREYVITGLYLDETPPYVEVNDNGYEPEYLLEEYEFIDGTPCGKLVEQMASK